MFVDTTLALGLFVVSIGAVTIATKHNYGKAICGVAFIFNIGLLLTPVFYDNLVGYYGSVSSVNNLQIVLLVLLLFLDIIGILVSRVVD